MVYISCWQSLSMPKSPNLSHFRGSARDENRKGPEFSSRCRGPKSEVPHRPRRSQRWRCGSQGQLWLGPPKASAWAVRGVQKRGFSLPGHWQGGDQCVVQVPARGQVPDLEQKKNGSGAKLGVPFVRQANWANHDEAHVGKGAPAILRRAFGPLITLGLWAFDQQGTRRSSKWLEKHVSKMGPQGNWREMDTKTSTCGILALKF